MKINEVFNIKEALNVAAAIIILTIVIGLESMLRLDYNAIMLSILFSLIIIITAVYSKKLMARMLDSDVEHEIWSVKRIMFLMPKKFHFGFKPHQHFKKPLPMGIILPLLVSAISLGTIKIMALLTYETKALKRRAAKRFGFYSFTEMTEFHNALIGAAGIVGILILAIVAYFIPIPEFEYLARIASFYAFFNMLPISKLDGSQIFFGSRILYTALALLTLIFTAYALILI